MDGPQPRTTSTLLQVPPPLCSVLRDRSLLVTIGIKHYSRNTLCCKNWKSQKPVLVGAIERKGARHFQGQMRFSRRIFLLKENIPDSYSDLTLIGPLFTETTKTTQVKSGQDKLSRKGPPFIFYFYNVNNKTGRD